MHRRRNRNAVTVPVVDDVADRSRSDPVAAAGGIPVVVRIVVACWVLSAILVLLASWPGYLNLDSSQQLDQAAGAPRDDWHAPFTVLVWSALLRVLPGASGVLCAVVLLVWGGCLVLALHGRRRGAPAAIPLAIAFLPLLPGLCNYVEQVQVDTILLGLLLGGTAVAALGRGRGGGGSALRALSVLLLASGALVRPNALFALVPLLLLLHADRRPSRNLLLCVVVVAAIPLAGRAIDRLSGATATGVSSAIPTYDLLALSHAEHRVLLPGRWTPAEARRITEGCYSPVQWDSADRGPCRFIRDGLREQGLWNRPVLFRRWAAATVRHPAVALAIQLHSFRQLLFAPSTPNTLWPAPNPRNDRIARPWPWGGERWRRYLESEPVRALSYPGGALALSAVAVLVVLARRSAPRHPAELALSVLLSGQVYLLGFLVYGIASEYRYAEWPMFAAVLGTLLAFSPRPPDPCRAAAVASFPLPVRLFAPLVAAASLAVLAGAAVARLPATDRLVSIRAIDARPVRVAAVTDATAPLWMAPPAPDVVGAVGWTVEPTGVLRSRGTGALLVRVHMAPADLRVRLLTGPGSGDTVIDSAGFHAMVSTGVAAADGRLDLVLPAAASGPAATRGFVWRVLLVTFVAFVLALVAAAAALRRGSSPGSSSMRFRGGCRFRDGSPPDARWGGDAV